MQTSRNSTENLPFSSIQTRIELQELLMHSKVKRNNYSKHITPSR
jgi:hypothetical protein